VPLRTARRATLGRDTKGLPLGRPSGNLVLSRGQRRRPVGCPSAVSAVASDRAPSRLSHGCLGHPKECDLVIIGGPAERAANGASRCLVRTIQRHLRKPDGYGLILVRRVLAIERFERYLAARLNALL
jgi:hypothetical protein